jgi:tubulin beta
MQASQCGSRMGTEFLEVVCDENGIRGDGKNFGDNDAKFGRICVFYHEASGGKHIPCALLYDLEPGVIDAVRASPLS